jgi:hypothetical protein
MMSPLIDVCHQTNLETLLLIVCLIDTDGINPEVQTLAIRHCSNQSFAILSKLPQSFFEISSNSDDSPIT